LRQSRLSHECQGLQSDDGHGRARDHRRSGEDREPRQARPRPRAHARGLRRLRGTREKAREADRAAHRAAAERGRGGGMSLSVTTPIRPARLRPDASAEKIETRSRAEAPATKGGHVVRGRALVFWDEKVAGKKRDAIDTDQITPAADCVSESLATLD